MNDGISEYGVVFDFIRLTDGLPFSYTGMFPKSTLTFVFNGVMQCSVEGETMRLSSGEAMFAPRGTRRARWDNTEPVRYCSLNFFQNENEIPLPYHIKKALSADIRADIDRLLRLNGSYSGYSAEISAHLTCAVIYQLIALESASAKPYIDDIKRFVSENFTKKLTLPMIASAVNLAPNYCGTLFRRSEGIPLFSYVTEVRVEHAKKLMSFGNMNLAEVAAQSGYENLYYFSRVFKKATGVSPGRWRGQVNLL